MWSFTSNGKRAKVAYVNNRYRLQVHELWLGRYGKLDHEGRLLSEGYYAILAEAKALAFTVLEKKDEHDIIL